MEVTLPVSVVKAVHLIAIVLKTVVGKTAYISMAARQTNRIIVAQRVMATHQLDHPTMKISLGEIPGLRLVLLDTATNLVAI